MAYTTTSNGLFMKMNGYWLPWLIPAGALLPDVTPRRVGTCTAVYLLHVPQQLRDVQGDIWGLRYRLGHA
jgi:hypothetical protein